MYLLKKIPFLFCFLDSAYVAAHFRILGPSKKLKEGESLSYIGSNDCEMTMQQDGNLIVKKGGEKTWSSEGSVPGGKGNEFFAKMLVNGRFVVRSKGQGKKPIFTTRTREMKLDPEEGGLYVEEDCSIKIARDNSQDIIWANVRTKLQCGNRLGKGEMFKFPESNPMYTLSLQHDGNLIIFRGEDRSDLNGKEDIVFKSDSESYQEDFYLEMLDNGYLVLKEKIENLKNYVEFWSMKVAENDGKNEGYSLTLTEDGFGYTKEPNCVKEHFTA